MTCRPSTSSTGRLSNFPMKIPLQMLNEPSRNSIPVATSQTITMWSCLCSAVVFGTSSEADVTRSCARPSMSIVSRNRVLNTTTKCWVSSEEEKWSNNSLASRANLLFISCVNFATGGITSKQINYLSRTRHPVAYLHGQPISSWSVSSRSVRVEWNKWIQWWRCGGRSCAPPECCVVLVADRKAMW